MGPVLHLTATAIRSFSLWHFYLQVRECHSILGKTAIHARRSFYFLISCLTILRNSCHESASVFIYNLTVTRVMLSLFNLSLQILDKGKLLISDLMLLDELVILVLQTPYSHLQKLILTLCLHSAVLIEFVLDLLSFIPFLPAFYFFPQFFFLLVIVLIVTAKFRNLVL